MSWSTRYDVENDVIIETFKGHCTEKDLLAGYQERMKIADSRQCRNLLIDVRECIVSKRITVAMYNLVEKSYKREESGSRWKIAVVKSDIPETQTIVEFYMNLTRNRGWNSKEFPALNEAIGWLSESTK